MQTNRVRIVFLLWLFAIHPLFAQTQKLPAEYDRALKLFAVKEYDKSLEVIRSVFDANSNSYALRMLAASNYIKLNQIPIARKHITQCQLSHPDRAEPYALMAAAYRVAGDLRAAYGAAMQGLIRFPNFIPLRTEMARTAIVMKNYPYAKSQIDVILRLDPNHFDGIYLEGILFLLQNRFEAAEFRFRNAMRIAENHDMETMPSLYNNLGVTLERQGDVLKATSDSNGSLQKYREALEAYQKAKNLSPSNPLFQRNGERLKSRLS